MKRLLISLFIFFCYSLAMAAVDLQLETTQVQKGQIFRLILTVDGEQEDAVPDLTPLQQDFTIVGTERNASYSVINGQARSMNQWIILLSPKKHGPLSIPPLQVGRVSTQAATVDVEKRQAHTPQQGGLKQDVMLTAEADELNPYINQQVIYTVKLYNSSRLLDSEYLPPQVEDALLIPLGEARHYQVTDKGRAYAVAEQRYAIFPSKSGELKITPPSFNAFAYNGVAEHVQLKAKPSTLKVKTIPPQYSGKNWLPAKQVRLIERYEPQAGSMVAGSTLTRTVILEAVGLPAQVLPALQFAHSDQFSVYPEKPSESNTLRQADLVGVSTVKVTYLLNQAGQISIPALTLNWFNTTTGKEETASLPAFQINVTAAKNTTAAQNPLTAPLPAKQEPPVQKEEPVKVQVEQPAQLAPPQTSLAWWLAGGFALAWLLTMGLWFWQGPCRSRRQSLRQALRQIEEACMNNKPSAARDALIHWAHLQWPEANLLNLTELAQHIAEPQLKAQLDNLAQFLYSKANSRQEWQGGPLWQCLVSFSAANQTCQAKEKEPLPPMHQL